MKFSIITPSYKQLNWLRTCIASVADQFEGIDAPPFRIEHIIQDGGTPGIEDIARETGAALYRDGQLAMAADPGKGPRDPRIELTIWCEPDSGMYDAINRGVSRACGEVAAWLNCDEQYLPGALLRVFEEMSRLPQVDLLVGGSVIAESDGSYRCHRPGVVQGYRALLRRMLTMQSCSLFFRRSIFTGGFTLDPSWKSAGDKEWILRMHANGIRMRGSRWYCAVYVETGSNLSSDAELNRAEEDRMLHTQTRIHPMLCKAGWWLHAARVLTHFRFHPPPRLFRIYRFNDTTERRETKVCRPTLRWNRRAPIKEQPT